MDSTTDTATRFTFTYDSYGTLLDGLLSSGFTPCPFAAVSSGSPGGESVAAAGKHLLLRHDVDWSPERALTMAQIEADRGVTATYFFLVSSPFYNPLCEHERRCIQEIEALGHRVGLHFSTHQYWQDQPGPDAVEREVENEQTVLGTIVEDVDPTVSFHIPPDWVLGRSYDGFENAYAPRYFEEIAYVSDSNQKWRTDSPFEGGLDESLQLLVHPGLWAESDEPFAARLAAERDARFDRIEAVLDDQYITQSY